MPVKLHSSLFVSGKIMAFPTCLLELYSAIGTIELGLAFRLGVANWRCNTGKDALSAKRVLFLRTSVLR